MNTVAQQPDLQLFGATAAARLLGRDRHFVMRAWNEGELDAIMIRGRYVTRGALERFLADRISRKAIGA